MRGSHLLGVFLALGVSGVSAAWAQTPSVTSTPNAEVSQIRAAGTAKRGLRPDLATITVQFSAMGTTPREAGRLVALKADSLRRAFSASGIPLDSLVSGSRWYWWRGRIEVAMVPRYVPVERSPTPRVTQVIDTLYKASDAIEVRVRDLSRVGSVIDSALAHGVTEISPVRFSATPSPEVQDALTREATRSARRQAEAMASASGSRLGRLLALSTQPETRYGYDPYGLSEISVSSSFSGGEPGATTVVQPSITVTTTIYGRWEVLPQ